MKHRIKLGLRDLWSRLLFHTGLYRAVDRYMPRRLLILAGHCVETSSNAGLPADMKISEAKLRQVLGSLGKRFELCTIGAGVRSLTGERPGRSMVALSMDDGYRDNHSALVPIMKSFGATATVFLESRVLDERRLNWSHKYFWLLRSMDPDQVGRQLMNALSDEELSERIRRVLEEGGNLAYRLKRMLKYDAPPEIRDPALDSVFRAHGGDEGELCDALYMSWDEVKSMASDGFELGGHTVNHPVLSTLEPAAAAREVEEGRAALATELGDSALESFAYPFGRRWDFDGSTVDAVRGAGFRSAVTTHSGVNTKDSDPYRLARWMIDEDTPLHLLVTEASGGFAFLRRFGLDLTE